MGDLDSLETIIVVQATKTECEMQEGRDFWFHEVMEQADAECPAEPLDAEHPLFILYTSGSTAKPKGILHTTGGYLTQVAYTHKAVFDLSPDEDVYFCSADVGWITGHSYIVYGPLANGATSVMYEGAPDYPAKDIWWELCERYGVTIFYTAPTAIRACIKWGREHVDKHDLSKLRLLGTVGRADQPQVVAVVLEGRRRGALPDRRHLVADGDRRDHDHHAAGDPGGQARARRASRCRASRRTWSRRRTRTPARSRATSPCSARGRACCGPSTRRRTASSRRTGTSSARRSTPSATPPARTRTATSGSSGASTTCSTCPATACRRRRSSRPSSRYSKVAEAAVIGQADEDTGQSVTAFVTLEGDEEGDDELVNDIREHVAKRIGKLARPKRIIWADDLPKTRSGKIMRRLLRDIAEGRELGDVTTLRDPDVMGQLEDKVKQEQAAEE